MRIIVASGGFDPLHIGHIAYLRDAKKLGDYLIVGANSDEWLTRKKGKPFMPLTQRASILAELRSVDKVMPFNDDDDSSCSLLEELLKDMPPEAKLVFVNGGDRTKDNIPEIAKYGDDSRVLFEFGVGGTDKKNSSSLLLEQWI